MNFYYCKKCLCIHYDTSKIFKTHSIHRKHSSEYTLSKYYCTNCLCIHKQNTQIYIKHYDFKSSNEELTSDENWINQFRKNWYKLAKQQKSEKK